MKLRGLGLGVLLMATSASAAPTAKNDPDRCPTPFDCGALSARLDDAPAAIRAIRRGCELEKTALASGKANGDSPFACEQYAQLLVSAGPARGGDPARGIAMLEAMCQKQPLSTNGSPSPCSTLARDYEQPPKASGLSRETSKAAKLRQAGCDQGDSLDCDALGRLYLKGGPGFPADAVKARAAIDKGCAGTDQYALGVCGGLGDQLLKGAFDGKPDKVAARPYLEKSCKGGYRCDLYIQMLLDEGKDDEALRLYDAPRGLGSFDMGWADKWCRQGHTVMCARAAAKKPAPGY